MCRILERACDAEQSAGILHVAVNAGFTDADVFAAGPSVLVTHDAGARKVAQDVARDLCDLIWSYRDDWARPMPLSDCIDHLKSTPTGDKPIVVADFSDNPGSGAYGDCTALLRELLRAGLRNAALGAVCDPEAAQGLTAAGEGATVALPIGGKTDPNVGGGPLTLTGIVTCVSDGALRFEGPMLAGVAADLGPSVCFQVEGIDIVIASNPMQVHDLNVFRCLGIEPAQKALVVVKSMQHFRAAFDPIAQEVLVVDAGGLSSPNVALRRYDRLRRPVFPLDQFDDPA
jgi:microcystin degradation protein MlrC